MSKTRKNRCWVCGGLNVIKWGIRNGKQRFKCKDCGASNTRKNIIKITSNSICFL